MRGLLGGISGELDNDRFEIHHTVSHSQLAKSSHGI